MSTWNDVFPPKQGYGIPPGTVLLWRCLEKCAQCSRHWVETHGDVRGCYVGGVCGFRVLDPAAFKY